jgi:hypothetical protein
MACLMYMRSLNVLSFKNMFPGHPELDEQSETEVCFQLKFSILLPPITHSSCLQFTFRFLLNFLLPNLVQVDQYSLC